MRIVLAIAALLTIACQLLAQESPDTSWAPRWPGLAQGTAKPTEPAPPRAVSGATSTPAEETEKPSKPPKEAEPWEIKFFVYGWVTGMDGKAGVGRKVSDVDVSYSDVLDNLNLIDCMVPVDLEVRAGHWGAYTDLLYVRLEDTVTRGPARVRLTAEQTILEIGGFYRLGTWPLGAKASDSSLTFDIIGGARYNRLEGNVGLEHPQHAISIGGTREWWDPIVGPRVIWRLNDKLSFFSRGDVGGFDIDGCSEFAWQVIAGGDYYFTKNFFLELGYRLLDTNYNSGSGRREFVYHVMTQGPYLAIGIRF